MTTRIQRHAALVALATATLFASAPAHAEHDDFEPTRHRRSNAHYTADARLVDVQVRVDGSTAPLYFRPGTSDRHYVQAFKGRNYSLVVRNNTGRRVGVLIAVDGLNVVNGERSNLSRGESMYVLDAYEESVIKGWRTSLRETRQFVFVDEERSYAERTGQANGDMGWIRVLAFREDEPRAWYRVPKVSERDRRLREERGDPGADELGESQDPEYMPPPAPQSKARDNAERRTMESEGRAMAPESNPGTGWGDRRYDPVRQTQFRAARRATDEIVLRYEFASGLRALGIFPATSRTWERERGQLGFSKPPRW